MDECRPSPPVKWMRTSDLHGGDILKAFQAHYANKYTGWRAGCVEYMLDSEPSVGKFYPKTISDIGELYDGNLVCDDPSADGCNAMHAKEAAPTHYMHTVTIAYSLHGQYMCMEAGPGGAEAAIYKDRGSFLEDWGVPSP